MNQGSEKKETNNGKRLASLGSKSFQIKNSSQSSREVNKFANTLKQQKNTDMEPIASESKLKRDHSQNSSSDSSSEIELKEKIKQPIKNMVTAYTDVMIMQIGRTARNLVHPSDWRNIPKCLVNTCSSLLERFNLLEFQFKQYNQKSEERVKTLSAQLLKLDAQCNQQISVIRTALNTSIADIQTRQQQYQETSQGEFQKFQVSQAKEFRVMKKFVDSEQSKLDRVAERLEQLRNKATYGGLTYLESNLIQNSQEELDLLQHAKPIPNQIPDQMMEEKLSQIQQSVQEVENALVQSMAQFRAHSTELFDDQNKRNNELLHAIKKVEQDLMTKVEQQEFSLQIDQINEKIHHNSRFEEKQHNILIQRQVGLNTAIEKVQNSLVEIELTIDQELRNILPQLQEQDLFISGLSESLNNLTVKIEHFQQQNLKSRQQSPVASRFKHLEQKQNSFKIKQIEETKKGVEEVLDRQRSRPNSRAAQQQTTRPNSIEKQDKTTIPQSIVSNENTSESKNDQNNQENELSIVEQRQESHRRSFFPAVEQSITIIQEQPFNISEKLNEAMNVRNRFALTAVRPIKNEKEKKQTEILNIVNTSGQEQTTQFMLSLPGSTQQQNLNQIATEFPALQLGPNNIVYRPNIPSSTAMTPTTRVAFERARAQSQLFKSDDIDSPRQVQYVAKGTRAKLVSQDFPLQTMSESFQTNPSDEIRNTPIDMHQTRNNFTTRGTEEFSRYVKKQKKTHNLVVQVPLQVNFQKL